MIIKSLSLAGHDSELFSFLEVERISELVSHPSAQTPLWTFGTWDAPEYLQKQEAELRSVCSWCTLPTCLAFTSKPTLEKCESSNGTSDRWHRYRGYTTDNPLMQVDALVLLRYLFVQGYTCSLDDHRWVSHVGDAGLQRLRFIRSNRPKTELEEMSWQTRKAEYFCWVFEALNRVPTNLGVARIDHLIDRCIETQRAG